MKFGKTYEAYMRGMEAEELPAVGIKRLKKMLKTCRRSPSEAASSDRRCTAGHCTVCGGSFFPSLLNEMSAVVGCFNEKAKKLLQLHLASGFRKYAMWFTSKGDKSHGRLIRQGKDLVTYAIINAVAMRKILKKYDKAWHSQLNHHTPTTQENSNGTLVHLEPFGTQEFDKNHFIFRRRQQ